VAREPDAEWFVGNEEKFVDEHSEFCGKLHQLYLKLSDVGISEEDRCNLISKRKEVCK
jgi:hypothetical protein